MEITVKIECETIQEFVAHLEKLKSQVYRKAIVEELNQNDEFAPHHAHDLYDDNCYGTHEVEITNPQ